MWKSSFLRFLADRRGNTAVMFALAAVPLMLGAGAAVDFVRAENVRTLLQGAADAAAIAGAASKIEDDAALTLIVTNYLKANGAEDVLANVTEIDQTLNKTARTFDVTIKGNLKTGFMALAGIDEMDLFAFSQVSVGGAALELVLSLDNTASMNSGGRLPALKSAAKSMVDTVLDGGDASGAYVKIGIVPFSNYVNVGLANRSASWITVEDDYSTTSNSCYMTYPNATSTNCHTVTYTGYNDGVPETYTTEVCDWVNGDPVEVCGEYTNNYTWNGCVGSRSHPNDTKISGAENYKGLLKSSWGSSVYCAAEITPLTSDKALLNARIDAMNGIGNTYIAPGVLWGWNMLDASQPIVGAKSKTWMSDNGGSKVLVLMTDGENTLSTYTPDPTLHDGSDMTSANAVTAATCENAKADGITIYTVALMVTNAAALDMLKNCASDPSKVFTADDPSALTAAFQDIANSLVATRLTK